MSKLWHEDNQELIDESGRVHFNLMEDIRCLEEQLQARPNTNALPVVTDEIWEELNETCLLTWKDGKPHWTQTAVDFICCLPH